MKRVLVGCLVFWVIIICVISAHAEVIAEIHTDGMENAIEISEPCPAVAVETTAAAPAETETVPKVYEAIILTQEDKDLLARILWAEANSQKLEGQKACVEVVYNRILSSDWPDNLYDVLSQRGQFATWKSRNKVTPTQTQYDAIEAVLEETETVLPDTSYVFFDRRGVNGRAHVRIQDHVFGR